MKIVAVGTRPPAWVREAVQEYAKRMPKVLNLSVTEVAAAKHHKDVQKFKHTEGEQILAQIKPRDWVVCLDERGRERTSTELAERMDVWQQQGQDLVLVIGGANGLSPSVSQRANETLALSKLTMPHYQVRVVLLEALYRAWTISTGHPYHRE